jgi:hypothetical protein
VTAGSLESCTAPAWAWVADATDCDDADAAIHPDAPEVCDGGADEDCDGYADADDPEGAIGGATWYRDLDGDGWGSGTTTVSCGLPAGFAAQTGDCRDSDAAYYPGAPESDCADPNDYNCDGSSGFSDDDSDGWVSCDDCDDADAAVGPGATESCDGVDNDCDGATDEAGATGEVPWFFDRDGDSYGDLTLLVLACEAPADYVGDATDCDERDSGIAPGAAAFCDVAVGEDEDFVGDVDADDADAVGGSLWFADEDGDGYGTSADTVVSCAGPVGYAAFDADCDDEDADWHPGADESDCTDPSDYNCDGSSGYVDDDGDGYASCEECDDGDSAVSPDSDEICNELDDDCDGTIDEPDAVDATAWYADLDGDGFGDPGNATVACAAPVSYGVDATDCDDTSSVVYPGRVEICNGVDDDCDGSADDADADVTDASTWYADADGDGWGDAGDAVAACDAPVGRVGSAGDCDDGDAAFHPGASEPDCDDPNDYDCDGYTVFEDADGDGYAECVDCDDADAAVSPAATETCDGVDNDCDAATDEASASDAQTFYDDDDSDGYGSPNTEVACVVPAGYTATPGDCDDSDATVSPAGVEVCEEEAVDEDCDGLINDFDPSQTAEQSWYADTDADGYGDVAVEVSACTDPGGYVTDATDCDDGSAAVYPGASEPDCTDPVDYDCDGSTAYADDDGDGYAACMDCDDTSASYHPGAAETCDGTDEDCDGTVDDGSVEAQTWYLDDDADGYGLSASTLVACADLESGGPPSGYAVLADDCDDTSAEISPAGSEGCNGGIDDDCDGAVDDDDAATGTTTWYVDADDDAWGDAALTSESCAAPSGSVGLPGDCDDSSAAYYPGASETNCADPEDYNCDGVTGYADVDGDLYAACEDCDDNESTVYPGATEHCDSVDEDCDLTVDNDAVDTIPYYRDGDSDGYGLAPGGSACSVPSGYSALSTDCNDANSTISPGDPELCDSGNKDEDCDGLTDDNDGSATGQSTFYVDADGDSYGTSASPVYYCDAAAGRSTLSTDCNDADASISPGDTETCATVGVDDDCDGSSNDLNATGCSAWYSDGDTDGYGGSSYVCACTTYGVYTYATSTDCNDGDAAISPGDLERCATTGVDDDCDGTANEQGASGCVAYFVDSDGDTYGTTSGVCACAAGGGYTALNNTDCNDANAGISPGDSEICNTSIDEDCDGVAGSSCSYDDEEGVVGLQARWYGEVASDNLGGTDAGAFGAGDVDGDGEVDVVFGAPYNDSAASSAGSAYVALGPHSGYNHLSTADAQLAGVTASDYAGGAIAVGDFNSDGYDDFLVSAYGNDTASSGAGLVYAVHGKASWSNVSLSTFTGRFTGVASYDYAGRALVVIGEENAGSSEDFAIASRDADSSAGAVYMIHGSTFSSTVSMSTASHIYEGEAAGDYAGDALGAAGDVDADGYDDLLVGAQGAGTAGAAYLILGAGTTGTISLASADAKFVGVTASDGAGMAVDGGGDVDADGYDDILIGAPYSDVNGSYAGTAYVFYGPTVGGTTYSLTAAAATLHGDAGEYSGDTLAGPGDTDGDGFADLLIGARYHDSQGLTDNGGVWLVLGPVAGIDDISTISPTVFGGYQEYDYLQRPRRAGDVDGDGFADFLMSTYSNENGPDSGVVYLGYGLGM